MSDTPAAASGALRARILGACLLLVLITEPAAAQREFTQSRQLLLPDGRELPPRRFGADDFAAFPARDYPLTGVRTLRIISNLGPERAGELAGVADRVAAAAEAAESLTGLALPGDALLYLVAVDSLPAAYRFSAAVPADADWCELRLALVLRDAPLLGPHGSPALGELLYDTFPHEFGHDLLDELPSLRQDVSGRAPAGTRWFCEGVCELIAMSRRSQAPAALRDELAAARDWRQRFDDETALSRLFAWRQDGEAVPARESALYGLAGRVLELWCGERGLRPLLSALAASPTPLDGQALRRLLASSPGLGEDELWTAVNGRSRALSDAAPAE